MTTSARAILENQPAFRAEVTFLVPDGRSDLPAGRMARKGTSFRFDQPPAATGSCTPEEGGKACAVPESSLLIRAGKPTVALVPELRGYVEFRGNFQNPRIIAVPSAGVIFPAFWLDDLLGEKGATFEIVGAESVAGHECLTIQAAINGQPAVALSAAADLENLVIKMVAGEGETARGLLLTGVSLDVPDELFEIPAGFKKLG